MRQKALIKLVGVLNVTPDSFSDGGVSFDVHKAIDSGKRLAAQGANIIEVGGDSTRPGSVCVGAAEEWRRIGAIVSALSKIVTVSVDTHHAETAKRALESGASYINDISAGSDRELVEHVARSKGKIVLMHTISAPHNFEHLQEKAQDLTSLFVKIKKYLQERITLALSQGIKRENIVIDPGMGAFISSEPKLSFDLLDRIAEFSELGAGLMLAVSRKGFLKSPGEKIVEERDPLSALIALSTTLRWHAAQPLYIRAHNVALHRLFIEKYAKIA